MKPVFFSSLTLLLLLKCTLLSAQLQNGECGIRYTYDASGNRTQRLYICNNTGSPMNRSAQKDSLSNINSEKNKDEEGIVKVNELYPNPGSGIFKVVLARGVKDGSAMLFDEKGNLVQRRKVNGSQLTFDLSRQSSGTYLLKIADKTGAVQLKVIKL